MSIAANVDGEITGKFTIPEGILAGTKSVYFHGTTSHAFATFVGNGTVMLYEHRSVITEHRKQIWYKQAYISENTLGGTYTYYGFDGLPATGYQEAHVGNDASDYPEPIVWITAPGGAASPYTTPSPPQVFDPLAQTFLLQSTVQISGLDLWFTAKGTGAQNVLVQIRECANGVPSYGVIAQAVLSPSDIVLNGWQRIEFTPATIYANQEYAIVIGATDSVTAIAVANMGEYDATAQQWVTTQPYQIGVMLSSSNNLTWTPHQTGDLTFRLLSNVYAEATDPLPTSTTVLEPIDVVDADQFIVLAEVDRPSVGCEVIFEITAGGVTYPCVENQVITLQSRFTGEITWQVIITGTQYTSPKVHKDITLVTGKRQLEGNYISTALDTRVSPTRLTVDMDMYIDAYLPSGATVTPTAQVSDVFEEMTLLESEELGEGWTELHYQYTDISDAQTRLELTLAGTAVHRPLLRNLRVALT